MNAVFNFINTYLFQWLFRPMMLLTGNNFAAAIFLFTLVVNLLLIPLSIKSQKASVQQTLVKPKLDKLRKKYGDDKQKFNTAMQELYAKENVSMSGGCLPMIIRLVLLMSVYYLVISPISFTTNVDKTALNSAYTAYGISTEANNTDKELELIYAMKADVNDEKLTDEIAPVKTAVSEMDLDFFGIDLTKEPQGFTLNLKAFHISWIIPFMSFATAMLSSLISMRLQKLTNPDAPSMAGMMLIMPLFSLFIAFNYVCGLGFYWACSSLIGGIVQAALQYFYGPYRMIAKQRTKNILKEYELEKKLID